MRQVSIFAFHPDENNNDWISYLSFDDLADDPIVIGEDIAVISPAGIRYAVVVDYDPDYSSYQITYTSDNLPELA
jgi:hypothetical protein